MGGFRLRLGSRDLGLQSVDPVEQHVRGELFSVSALLRPIGWPAISASPDRTAASCRGAPCGYCAGIPAAVEAAASRVLTRGFAHDKSASHVPSGTLQGLPCPTRIGTVRAGRLSTERSRAAGHHENRRAGWTRRCRGPQLGTAGYWPPHRPCRTTPRPKLSTGQNWYSGDA